MKSREPEVAPRERAEGLLDKGTGERSPSARYLRASEELAIGGAKSRYQALVRAGYKESTARNPSQNGFEPVEMLQTWQQHAPKGKRTWREVAELGRDRMAADVVDPETPAGTVAMIALGAAKAAVELDENAPEKISQADYLHAQRKLLQARHVEIRECARHGVEEAKARLDRDSVRIFGCEYKDVPRRFEDVQEPALPYTSRIRS